MDMTKLSMIPISLALVAGIAHAQAPKADKAAPPAADKKAPPADSKPNPDAKPPVAAKPPEMPKPSQEMADMIKGMTGTWKCTGQAEIMGSMMDVKATITHKSDLNGWWVRSDFTGTAGKLPPMKFTMYTTYDPTSKKMWRTQVSAMGNHSVSMGTMADKKASWEGDAHWAVGDVKIRGSEEMVSPKEVHIMGEYSKDGGKTWNKDHDATCKK
jgi:hypothetical protein